MVVFLVFYLEFNISTLNQCFTHAAVRLQRLPNIYFEVVLIYLHSWLSNTTKEVNPFRNMKTKDVENK